MSSELGGTVCFIVFLVWVYFMRKLKDEAEK